MVRYPPVKDLAFSTARSRDWDDLLTVHEGEGTARSWSVGNKRKGDFNFAAMDKSQKKSGQGQNALDRSVEAGNATVRQVVLSNMVAKGEFLSYRQSAFQLAATLLWSVSPTVQTLVSGTCSLVYGGGPLSYLACRPDQETRTYLVLLSTL